jgi:hypothetical protein
MRISRRKRAAGAGAQDPCAGSKAGTSFVEILVAVAVFTTGMVSIMGGVMTLTVHRRVSDERAQASALAGSAFENLRGLSISNILAYDVPTDNADHGTIYLSGVGEVTLQMYAVIPGANDTYTLFELGVGDVAGVNVAGLPNPIEIHAVMTPYLSEGESSSQFTASTKIDY